jgi:protein disulfide-isomerase A6
MHSLFWITLALALVPECTGSVVLTSDNFQQEVVDSGKFGFVKFMAPWCGHCNSMKPAWESLADGYETSETIVIGDVDCTVQASLCADHGVKGYPTIKYFPNGADGVTYSGGRDLAALQSLVLQMFVPSVGTAPDCNVQTLEDCSPPELGFIAEMEQQNSAYRQLQIVRLDKLTTGADLKPAVQKWIMARLSILHDLE